MKSQPVPFAAWLPILAIGIWLVLFAVPATLALLNLEQAAHGTGMAHVGNGYFSADIPRDMFVSFALQAASVRYGHTIMAVNIPGMLIEVLISLPTTWPSGIKPPGMMLEEWRVLSLPIFCLPAWWLVGRGFDVLVRRRRLHWSALFLGSILFIFCTIAWFGLRFGMSAAERGEVVFPLWGLGLWSILFSVLPWAWWQQGRQSKLQPQE